jgi:hypothetical protein
MPSINNVKEAILIFDSLFQKCQFIMVGRAWWSKAAQIIATRKQRRGIQEGARKRYSPKGTTLNY